MPDFHAARPDPPHGQRIDVPGLPPNNVTYSQATRCGGLLFVAGHFATGTTARPHGRPRLDRREDALREASRAKLCDLVRDILA